MSYFQPDQIKTIRQQWIPGIVQVLALAVTIFFVKDPAKPYNQILYGVAFFIFTGWTFIEKRNWQQLGIYTGVWAAALAVSTWARSLQEISAMNVHWHALNGYLFIGTCILARQFLVARRHFLRSGLLLWALLAITGTITPLNFYYSAMYTPMSYGAGNWLPALRLLLTSALGFAVPFIFYGQAFLIRNYFEQPRFKSLLKSKVLVTGKQTYLFLYLVLFLTVFGCAMQLPNYASIYYVLKSPDEHSLGTTGVYVANTLLLVFAVFCLAVALLGLYLMRNLVTGRMVTTQQSNGLVFAMHFIPVLNLLAMFMLYDAPQKNHTPKENAQYYIQRDTSALAHWIVVLGVLLALIGGVRTWLSYDSFLSEKMYSFYAFGDMDNSGMQLIKLSLLLIIAGYFIKVLGYVLLYNHRSAVFFIVTMNILLLVLTFLEVLPLAMLFSIAAFASFFVLMEIFHPALHNDDALLLTEPEIA